MEHLYLYRLWRAISVPLGKILVNLTLHIAMESFHNHTGLYLKLWRRDIKITSFR